MKKKLITALLALHLLVILAGTNMVDFGKVPTALQAPVAWYLAIVGGHNYSFFSPDIPKQTIVRCEVTYDFPGKYIQTFDKSDNTLDLRTTYLYQILCENHDYETAAKIAARYWFIRSPSRTKHVRVSIGTYVVPTMEECKAGKRDSFSELYSEDFSHE